MWVCSECRSEVEDEIDVCWKCQANRDGKKAEPPAPLVDEFSGPRSGVRYDLGKGIEIHITDDGKLLRLAAGEPPKELDIANTSLGVRRPNWLITNMTSLRNRTNVLLAVVTLLLAGVATFLGLLFYQTGASLLIEVDSDCKVTVNGDQFSLRAGDRRKFAANAGDNDVRAVSQRHGIGWKQLVHVGFAESEILTIELHDDSKISSRDLLPYIWVSGGSFTMGCSDYCTGKNNELPAHSVAITGFWLGQTPATNAAYQRIMGTNASDLPEGQRPASVSWTEASEYCAAIGMRLPTEAEWEYAGRAGRKDDVYGERVYGQREDQEGKGTVAQQAPNDWRVYDMPDTEPEWTGDWYAKDYYSRSPSVDPLGPPSGQERVLRQGWPDRFGRSPDFGDFRFRCAGNMVN